MKISFLYIIFVLISSSSIFYGQGLKDDKGKIVQTNYFEEIDFEVVHDKIVVPIKIDNKTYRFMLDTGAPNLISSRLAKKINLRSHQSISVRDANNIKDRMKIGNLKSMKIGNLTSENNLVLINDLNNHSIFKCLDIDGIIGSNFFKDSILKISLKEKKIWITDKVDKLNLTVIPSNLSTVGDQLSPVITVTFLSKENINGTEELLIDTGMDGFYDISNRFFKKSINENVFNILSKTTGEDVIGLHEVPNEKTQYLLQTNYLKINETIFSNVITTTTESRNSRIGIDILKFGDMTLDFKNKKFYYEAANNIALNETIPIYTPTISNGKTIIGLVWDSDYANEMQYGDEIISAGSYNISKMGLCEIIKLQKINAPYELVIKNKNQEIKKIKITPKQ